MSGSLTERIAVDLITLLRAGQLRRDELTLPALARRYEVSLTPVRHAVRRVIDSGYLRKRPNGRLEPIAARPRQSSGAVGGTLPVRRSTAADSLMQRVTDDIIGRSLLGRDDSLREEATAADYGVGRTVMRQLLTRLAGQGIVEHVPRRGFRIHPFDAEDLRQYLEVREALECRALELCAGRLDLARLEQMREANDPSDEHPRLDNQLHAYLITTSGNRYVIDFFRRHGPYYVTLLNFAAPQVALTAEMARQHRDILSALIRGDAPAARAALSQHIRAQLPVVEQLISAYRLRHPGTRDSVKPRQRTPLVEIHA